MPRRRWAGRTNRSSSQIPGPTEPGRERREPQGHPGDSPSTSASETLATASGPNRWAANSSRSNVTWSAERLELGELADHGQHLVEVVTRCRPDAHVHGGDGSDVRRRWDRRAGGRTHAAGTGGGRRAARRRRGGRRVGPSATMRPASRTTDRAHSSRGRTGRSWVTTTVARSSDASTASSSRRRRGIEVRRRLVEHEHLRVHREHGGDRDPPALPEAEVVRRGVEVVPHAHRPRAPRRHAALERARPAGRRGPDRSRRRRGRSA